ESHRDVWGRDQARVPPLREPTRSREVNAKKRRGLASVGMTVGGWARLGRFRQGLGSAVTGEKRRQGALRSAGQAGATKIGTTSGASAGDHAVRQHSAYGPCDEWL